MIKLIDEAIEVLRNLPETTAAAAARTIIQYSAEQDDNLVLSDKQADEVERRLNNPDRKFLSLEDLHKNLDGLRT